MLTIIVNIIIVLCFGAGAIGLISALQNDGDEETTNSLNNSEQ